MNDERSGRLLLTLLGLVHTAVLQWLYVYFVSPLFAYQGMLVQQLPGYLIAWQFVFAILPTPWLPVGIRKPSEFQALLLYVVVYLPSVVLGYHICRASEWGAYSGYLALAAALLAVVAQVRRLPVLQMPDVGLTPSRAALALAVISVGVYAALLVYYGVPDDIFDVADIYLSREDFKEKVLNAPVILGYLYFWQGIIINPTIIIFGALSRSFVLLAVGIALQYLLFAITTLRSVALAIPFSIFMAYFFRRRVRWSGLAFSGVMTAAMTVGGIATVGGGVAAIAGALFVQRWLMIQGQLSGAYIDFFVNRDKLFYGAGALHGLVPYSYGSMSPGQVIGDNYVSMGQLPVDNAPANFWADAFAQAGFAGMVWSTMVACVLLWLTDSVFRDLPRGMGVMLFACCALTLTEQGVETCILTGGWLPLIIIGAFAYKLMDRVARA